jgi:hypothetical protein
MMTVIERQVSSASPPGKQSGARPFGGCICKIMLREEFSKMNELTGTIVLSSGVQERVSDKSPVDSWRTLWCGGMIQLCTP